MIFLLTCWLYVSVFASVPIFAAMCLNANLPNPKEGKE